MSDFSAFINRTIKDKEEGLKSLPMAEEFAWDYDKQEFKFQNGKFFKVREKEAIKIWLWKLFQTPRFRYRVYNGDYGEELRTLIGRGYTQGLVYSESKRYVEEAIRYNLAGYVTHVKNFEVKFNDGVLTVRFRAITPYGDFNWEGGI